MFQALILVLMLDGTAVPMKIDETFWSRERCEEVLAATLPSVVIQHGGKAGAGACTPMGQMV